MWPAITADPMAPGRGLPDGRYRLQFHVQNLFDQFYVATIGGQETVGVAAAQILDYTYKRRFGVSLEMDW